ncbi:MAG: hypothetical protein LLG42_11070 [Chloroflexi bacterium]|nr:hypothetical protein [Chloroflexota bacterium]
MSDFDTISARPLPEKPEGESEKKEEKKPAIEIEDWSAEPPAPEPEFFKANDDATITSGGPLHIEPEPIEEIKEVEPVIIEDAKSAQTVAFEPITTIEAESFEAPKIIDIQAVEEPGLSEPKPAEPVYHIPEESKPVEPEVLDTPVYKPAGESEPPKKNNTWWIILLVVLLLLCVCCVVIVVLIALLSPENSFSTFSFPFGNQI